MANGDSRKDARSSKRAAQHAAELTRKYGGIGTPKLTKDLQEQVCDRLRAGNFRGAACASVGINSQTLQNWLRQAAEDKYYGKRSKFRRFSEACDRAENEAEHIAVQMARRAGKDDWRFWTWWLEHKVNKRWGIKAQISIVLEKEREKMLDIAEHELSPAQYRKLLTAIAASSDNDNDSPSVEALPGEDAGGAGEAETG